MEETQQKQLLLSALRKRLEENSSTLPLAGKPEFVVPPEGSPGASVMFIGEAAGFHELRERRPFVGAAGQLLTKTLESQGMKRKDVWISNMVKARPPENRDPLPEEIEAYQPYLDAEISILQPKIVVTLGRFSMAKFFGPLIRISQVHGQPRWVDFTPTPGAVVGDPALSIRFVVLPMYHPAAALRSGAMMDAFLTDFKKLPEILKKLEGRRDDKIEETTTIQKLKEEPAQLSLI